MWVDRQVPESGGVWMFWGSCAAPARTNGDCAGEFPGDLCLRWYFAAWSEPMSTDGFVCTELVSDSLFCSETGFYNFVYCIFKSRS